MATFNWTYKNGFSNPYGLVIPSTADDATRPSGVAYVAPWGNDTTGNGSRRLPYRTLAKGSTIAGASGLVIIAPGVYREAIGSTISKYVGDGNVIIDGTLIASNLGMPLGAFCYNITFRGVTNVTGNTGTYTDCTFFFCKLSDAASMVNLIKGCTFINSEVRFGNATVINSFNNNTFYRSNVLFLGTTAVFQSANANIFNECNVSFASSPLYLDYSLFYNCNFRFNATTLTGGTTLYPSVPSGYSSITDITSLRAANVSAFGAATYNFNNSAFGDPLFNNPAIYDFTLQETSPAKNRSYFGLPAGAYSIAKKIGVKSTASLSDFDNASAVNLMIADDSITLTSTASAASIETKPIANLNGRIISKFSALGLNADRNGEYISSVLSLSASTLSPGAVPINTPYYVEGGSITYNGNTYTAGDRFTSAATSMSFTTSTGGVLREILQAPSRQVVEARFTGGGGSLLDNTATLTVGTWYYVESGSATYNSNTYAAGTFFKCVTGVTSFTGTGQIRSTFASGDTWYLFELGVQPTTNNVGNVSSGAISMGNGNESFDRTPANVFPVNAKFIQLKYTIQVANLVS